MKKTLISLLVVVMLVLALSVTAMAAESASVGDLTAWNANVVNADADTVHIKLTAVLSATVEIPEGKTVYLDLCGQGIETVINYGTLYLLDSESDGYVASGAKIGTILENQPVREFITSQADYGHKYRYITIKEASGYSAHRYYMGVLKSMLYPNTSSFYYQPAFVVNSVVKTYVGDYGLYIEKSSGGATTASLGEGIVAYAENLDPAVWQNHVIVDIKNVLHQDDVANWVDNAEVALSVNTYITLTDGFDGEATVSSTPFANTFIDMVRAAQKQVDTDSNIAASDASAALTDMYQRVVTAEKGDMLKSWNGEGVRIPYYCVCGAYLNGGTHKDGCNEPALWKPWTGITMPKTEGHWYISDADSIKNQADVGTANVNIFIDLNGKTIETTKRLFSFTCTDNTSRQNLTITDSVGGGSVNVTLASHSVLMMNQNNYSAVTFNLYGGHLNASDSVSSTGTTTTGAIRLRGNAEINLFGGKISGQQITVTGGQGGAIYLDSNSTINMSGSAEIVGGDVTGNGAGIYMAANSTLTMNEEASISGGHANQGGGVFVASSGTLIMNGGNITGNYADKGTSSNGGGIYTSGGTIKIYGGNVTGNSANQVTGGKNYNADINAINTKAFDVIDGELGYVTVYTLETATAAKVALGGQTLIEELRLDKRDKAATDTTEAVEAVYPVIEIPKDAQGTAKPLTGDAEIGLFGSAEIALVNSAGDDWADNYAYAGFFDTEYANMQVTFEADGVHLRNNSTYKYHCICGLNDQGNHFGDCDKFDEKWTAWPDNKTTMPNTEGYWYIADGSKITSQADVGTANVNIFIDLNGQTINISNRLFSFTCTDNTSRQNLTIMDSVGGGSANVTFASHSVLMMNQNNNSAVTFNLYGGHLNASASSYAYTTGAIRLRANSVMNLFGGKISGQTLTSDNANGGAIYMDSDSTINMSGSAEIVGGDVTAYGAGIYMAANSTLTMDDEASISGGHANQGGGVFVASSGTLIMNGGTITGNYADKGTSSNGGGIYTSGGTIKIYGGNVTGNSANQVTGGKNYNADINAINTKAFDVIDGELGNVTVLTNNTATAAKVALGGQTVVNELRLNKSGDTAVYPVIEIPKDAQGTAKPLTGNAKIGLFGSAEIVLVNSAGDNWADNYAYADFFDTEYTNMQVTFEADGVHLRNNSTYKYHCICGLNDQGNHFGDCDKFDEKWTAWPDNKTTMPNTEGYWYIADGSKITSQATVSTANVNIHIDLNGQTINTSNRLFSFTASSSRQNLTIMDSVGSGSVNVALTTSHTPLMMNQNGNVVIFNLYGGHLNASGSVTSSGNTKYGAIRLRANSEINLFGGKISGHQITVSGGQGGAIYLDSNSTINMSGSAEIVSGTVTSNGAGIFMAANSRLNISGDASISGGTSTLAAACDIFNNGGQIHMNGGSIDYISNNGSSQLCVQGNAKVDYVAMLGTSMLSIEGKLGEEADINISRVDATDGKIMAATGTMDDAAWMALLDADASAIRTSIANKIVQYKADGIYVVSNTDGAIFCPFGCTGEEHSVGCQLAPYIQGISLSSYMADNGNAITESGYYYLTDNIDLDQQIIVGSSDNDSKLDVILDLNGYNISSSGKRVLQIWNNAELTLQNTGRYIEERSGSCPEDGGGVIDSTGTSTCDPYAILQTVTNTTDYPDAGPTVNMRDGVTLKNSDNVANYNCGGVLIRNNAVFNMYGGKVEGSNVAANVHSEGLGTCACANTQVKESGNGGAFYVQRGGTLNVYGGEIVGAEVEGNGGAIYNAGTVTVKDAVITNGTAGACGGSIYNTGTLSLDNVTITNANATADGGAIYTTQKFTINGDISITGDVFLDDVKLNLGQNLRIAQPFNVVSDIRFGAFTEGADASKNTGKITLNGEAAVVRGGIFCKVVSPAPSGELQVGFGSRSIAPTEEQLRFTNEGYRTTYQDGNLSGNLALELDGYAIYPAGKTLGTAQTVSGYNSAYNALMTQAVAYLDDDGDLILMVSVDSTNVNGIDKIKQAVLEKTGVLIDNIMISATHAHSTPVNRDIKIFYNAQGEKQTLSKSYYETVRDGIVEACVDAINDLAKVDSVYTATVGDVNSSTYTFNCVRNYKAYNRSGTQIGMVTPNHNSTTTNSIYKYEPESEVDASVQLVKYERTGKNAMIIANFQTHPLLYGTGGNTDGIIHTDGIGPFRGYLSEMYGGADVVYFSGAGGNVKSSDDHSGGNNVPGEGIALCLRWGKELATVVKNNAGFNEITLNTNVGMSVQTVKYDKMVDGEVNGKSVAERLAMAEAIKAKGVGRFDSSYTVTLNGTEYDGDALRKDWKIYSYYHAVNGLIARKDNKAGDQGEVKLYAYAAGNIAFAAAPYEMFDTNGMQIKTGKVTYGDNTSQTVDNNFDMTIVATKTGNKGYVPSYIGFKNGGYSTDISPYAEGTGEMFALVFLNMLNGLN